MWFFQKDSIKDDLSTVISWSIVLLTTYWGTFLRSSLPQALNTLTICSKLTEKSSQPEELLLNSFHLHSGTPNTMETPINKKINQLQNLLKCAVYILKDFPVDERLQNHHNNKQHQQQQQHWTHNKPIISILHTFTISPPKAIFFFAFIEKSNNQ